MTGSIDKEVEVSLYVDELYPFFDISDTPKSGNACRRIVPTKTLVRWKRVMRQFDKVQREIGDVMRRQVAGGA